MVGLFDLDRIDGSQGILVNKERESLFALPLSVALPGDLPKLDGYPFAARTESWYVVVRVTEDDAVVEDVRRSDWPLPDGVEDHRDV